MNKVKGLVVLFTVVLLAGCNTNTRVGSIVASYVGDSISQIELKHMMDTRMQYILIDANPANTYQYAHIPTAVSLPVREIKYVEKYASSLNDMIIVYASEEVMQRTAYRTLVNMGYTSVYMLEGGFASWTFGYESE